jgi:hypothetical protein
MVAAEDCDRSGAKLDREARSYKKCAQETYRHQDRGGFNYSCFVENIKCKDILGFLRIRIPRFEPVCEVNK